MGRVAFAVAVFVGSVVGLCRASLYAPDEPKFLVPVGADGKAQALDFDDFRGRLAALTNARDETKKDDRKSFLERIERAKGKKLSAAAAAALAADLLRIGRTDESLNVLAPLRDRRPDYFVLTAMAQIHAVRGEWDQAIELHTSALLDAEMPATVKGLTKPQRDWWEKLDREVVPHYYRLGKQHADARRTMTAAQQDEANKNEEPLPLFPVHGGPGSPEPVRFVNAAGKYEPGNLAPAERAKLPPDAIATVQQLVFWFPQDSRLYWLLGELYAADGKLPAAGRIFYELPWSHKYGNRKVLMEHRAAVEAAAAKAPQTGDVPLVQPAPPAEAPPTAQPGGEAQQPPISMRTVWIYFGVVALVAVFAFVRAMARRGKGDCGPVG